MEKKKTDAYQVLFIVPAAIIFPKITESFTSFIPLNNVLLAAISGVLGVLFGLGIYRLVQYRQPRVKILAVVGMVVILFGAFILTVKR